MTKILPGYIGAFSSNKGTPAYAGVASDVALNKWIHITIVFGSTAANDTFFYINNTLWGAITDTDVITITNAIWQIGGSNAYTANWNGYFADFRYYNGVTLTSQQIQAIYNIGFSTAYISSYSATRSGVNVNLSWTGTNISSVTLSNFTTKVNYGKFVTSGVTYSGIVFNDTVTFTDKFYLTAYDITGNACVSTSLFTIS